MAIKNISVLVILFLYEVITTNAQECDTLPSDSTIESNLQSLLVSEAVEPPDIDPNLLTCNVHMYDSGYDNVLSLLILLQHHLLITIQ